LVDVPIRRVFIKVSTLGENTQTCPVLELGKHVANNSE
jgi:hypothetical protein